MTWGDYWKERDYYAMHFKEHWMGTYIPLWKQKLEKQVTSISWEGNIDQSC